MLTFARTPLVVLALATVFAIGCKPKAPAPGASAIGKLQITGGGSTWVYYLKGV